MGKVNAISRSLTLYFIFSSLCRMCLLWHYSTRCKRSRLLWPQIQICTFRLPEKSTIRKRVFVAWCVVEPSLKTHLKALRRKKIGDQACCGAFYCFPFVHLCNFKYKGRVECVHDVDRIRSPYFHDYFLISSQFLNFFLKINEFISPDVSLLLTPPPHQRRNLHFWNSHTLVCTI